MVVKVQKRDELSGHEVYMSPRGCRSAINAIRDPGRAFRINGESEVIEFEHLNTTEGDLRLIDCTYDFAHNFIPFHCFVTLADIREWNNSIDFCLEFPRDDILQGMFQELILQFLLIVQGSRA